MKAFTIFALLAGSALATPPACLLACVAQVSKANNDCSNNIADVKCVVENLGDKVQSCVNSICPNGNSNAANQAFQAVANEFQASAPSGSASSSAVPSSSVAPSSEPPSSASPSSAVAASSSAAPSETSSVAATSQPASSAEPVPSISAESSLSCIPWTSTSEIASTPAAKPSTTVAPPATTTSAPPQTTEAPPASSASVAPEVTSAPLPSTKPVNAAGAAYANTFGVVGAFAAAMLL